MPVKRLVREELAKRRTFSVASVASQAPTVRCPWYLAMASQRAPARAYRNSRGASVLVRRPGAARTGAGPTASRIVLWILRVTEPDAAGSYAFGGHLPGTWRVSIAVGEALFERSIEIPKRGSATFDLAVRPDRVSRKRTSCGPVSHGGDLFRARGEVEVEYGARGMAGEIPVLWVTLGRSSSSNSQTVPVHPKYFYFDCH